jgi:lysophospholipase L1-like esterase
MRTLSSSPTRDTLTTTPHPLKIVALGDSLVYGYGDPVGGGWVERLRRLWMGSSDHALYNLGIRGDRVIQVSERLEQEFRLRGEIRNRLPDRIFLSVGVNDTARLGRPDGRTYTDLDLFRSQVEHLLDRARSLCPVFYVGMVPVDERKMPFLDCFYFNHLDQYRFKEATKQACLEKEIPYLDLFDLWMARGDDWCRSCMMDDGLHPNVKGYQTILQDVLDWQAIAALSGTKGLVQPVITV